MKNKRLFPLAFTAVCCLGISSAFSAPYTGWMNDYTGAEANTIGLWKFESDPGYTSDSYDGSANPNAYPVSLIHVGNTTTGVQGKFGTGISIIGDPDSTLNQSRAFTTSNAEGLFNGSAISVEVWYKTPSVLDTGYVFDKRSTVSGDTNHGLNLRFNADNLIMGIGNGSNWTELSIAAPVLSTETWYHLAATYENINGDGILKIFNNGTLLGQTTVTGFGNLSSGTRGWSLGNRTISNWSPLTGTYDNIRISDVAYEYSAVIPEPATLTLFLLAPLLGMVNRRKHHAK